MAETMTDTTVNITMNTIIDAPAQFQENTTILYPPEPPLLEIYERGTFLYVKDTNTRQMLVNCWQAVNLTEMWDFMKKDPGKFGFQFCDAPEIDIIRNKMNELPNAVGHSGFSAGWTLRQIQFIGKYGEDEFKKIWINNSN